MTLTLSELLSQRRSIRAFKNKPVATELLAEIFQQAQQSPSNCNVQPWQSYVVSGEAHQHLAASLTEAVMTGQAQNPDFDWRSDFQGVLRDRQVDAAVTLYNAMDIERNDKPRRQAAMLRNWDFFGAPHAVFFTMSRTLGLTGAVDLGIYAQSLSLLMAEHGISSCMQGALGAHPDPVREQLGIPAEMGVLFGMSFGYADLDADVNQAKPGRTELSNAVKFFN